MGDFVWQQAMGASEEQWTLTNGESTLARAWAPGVKTPLTAYWLLCGTIGENAYSGVADSIGEAMRQATVCALELQIYCKA